MASRIEARANRDLLVWARETAGFPVGVAADRLKVPADRLEAWERGDARPSLSQLRKIASCTSARSPFSTSRARLPRRIPSTISDVSMVSR